MLCAYLKRHRARIFYEWPTTTTFPRKTGGKWERRVAMDEVARFLADSVMCKDFDGDEVDRKSVV